MLPRHVYVHVPFCVRRCSYCDFSIAVRRAVPDRQYADSIAGELALRFDGAGAWTVDTLYLGGGTPSHLGAEGVTRLMDALQARIALADGAEVTLEANPEDISAEAVTTWRTAGINRLSIGAQSFDDSVLRWMHRSHDAAVTDRAVAAAREAGVDNLSLDLIFALPSALGRSWERDVDHALALGPEHLSLYGLTIELHTPLGRWQARGEVSAPPDEGYESEFLYAHRALTAAGFEHYEVSNFARPGRAARHNAAYWSQVSYAGIGPSAHGFDGRTRRWNAAAYADWTARIGAGRDPIDGQEALTEENRSAEEVYLGLRTLGGLALTGPEIARANRWVAAEWARLDTTNRLVLTAAGWLRLDALATDLTLVRSR